MRMSDSFLSFDGIRELFLPNLKYLYKRLISHFLSLAVAPVVPELSSDADTSNFDDIPDPEAGDETFDKNQVVF